MRYYLFFASILFVFASCESETPVEKAIENKELLSANLVSNPHTAEGIDTTTLGTLSTMDFVDTVHDFGLIYDGEVGVYNFEFTNNGKSPLVISSAKGSCGCTVPNYPKKPVAPGERGVIEVKFNSKDKQGHVEKSVVINTNSIKGVHMLYIKADVKLN